MEEIKMQQKGTKEEIINCCIAHFGFCFKFSEDPSCTVL